MSDSTQPLVLELWTNPEMPTPAPAQEVEFENPNVDHLRFLRNVTLPTLTAFLPDSSINTGTAMIVCPGGGLHVLAIDYEGLAVARWLCQRGIAAFVLKYRLIPTPVAHDEYQAYFDDLLADKRRLNEVAAQFRPSVLADGQQAVKIVRQRASEWGIMPDFIGMVGFSAGAFLTVTTTLHADEQNRPNFAASIYGAMWESLDVAAPLPPLFIALTDDDALSVEPSLELYRAWHQAKSLVEMHIYASGGHGFAMRNKNVSAEGWIERMYEWMQVQGLVQQTQKAR